MELRPPYLYKKFPSLVTAIQVYHTRINKNFITDRNSRMALSSFFYAMAKRIRASREVQLEIDNEVLFDTSTTGDDVVVGVTDDTTIKKMFGALSDADLEIAAAGFEGRGKTKQVLLQREQRISNKRESERTRNSFDDNDNDKLQQKQQQSPPRPQQQQRQQQNSAEDEEESTDDDDDNDDEDEDEVPLTLLSCLKRERERISPSLQQQQKKKQKKTITNRKNTTTNDVVNNNNDEIGIPVSLSPSASIVPLESNESASESVVMSVSSETQQLPSTTPVVGTASTLLVHEKHATTTHAAATASVSASASLLSSSPVAAVLATDSLRRTMEGSSTPDTTTHTAVRRAVAPVTSISYPLVQPSPSSLPPPIAAASANTNTNAASGNTQIQDSFRFHGQDKIRFNTLFNVELEYIHNRKNGRNLQVNFTGIAAMMNCDIQQVMSHFEKSGREQEIKNGHIEQYK
eukprot:CAMPEP_0170775348 /NCGR_PEP_ID=MMETSP0733-20121128/10533_1 /TAXON_ID=186038 /ORGANISM="Fragilariopsis kerguelensis, Strain L26-C5" /LENGTH=460 /DNA_ID=CAMNT_0011118145 /DNA_START=109 /DNA_END=1491 /DNA_ORIENTATION=+